MRSSLLSAHWLPIILVLLATSLPPEAGAQSALDHVDLSSPRMSAAELTRAEVEGLIAAASRAAASTLPIAASTASICRGSTSPAPTLPRPLNRAKLLGTRLDGAKLDMSWGIEADLRDASLKGAAMFQAQFPRARLDRADLSGARIIGSLEAQASRGRGWSVWMGPPTCAISPWA